ncbi:acetyl esterase/lipase [Nocardiopsis sp. Huas11]|uniref:alpha/beta hydrolase n=1 Tax=Nocardiopsis sp. Huas11 TaxID=2183912 RepID=UPI000EB1E011|nr:alpha/beta hydrolase [Nocardiopsis sp. Huas11]RKS09274.1 acetyl esterase/lipase [Nocardiopsis sp. Huas11]
MSHGSSRSADPVRSDTGLVYARRATGDLLLDLHRPSAADRPVPVVLWLHGGGWFTGDRTLAPDLAHHVRATGFAYASIEYRLSGQALFPAQLHDVRAAIRFLRARAGQYGLDPGAVGAWGASAGGHLAALVGLTGHLADLPGEEETGGDPSVRAVAESYGPVDLAAVAAEAARAGRDPASSPEARLLGGPPSERAELARYANPLTWVSPAAPPFQISHGTGDDLVSHTQSERLHEALAAVGVPSDLYLLDGYRHGFLNPAGRLDVRTAALMDDGRLAAEGRAPAAHHGVSGPGSGPGAGTKAVPGRPVSFGFDDIDAFFRRHLAPGAADRSPDRPAADPRPRSTSGEPR